jgi:type IV pilus assembly protein PilO
MSQIESVGKLPVWQSVLVGVLGLGLLSVGFYFSYYEEAAQSLERVKVRLAAEKTELKRVEEQLANFQERLKKAQEDEARIQELLQQLPRTRATVDHLMKDFQRQARLVGLDLKSWEPGGEAQLDYYAKQPVSIVATGTWHQAAEFFRRVSELKQYVNIEEVQMKSQPKDGNKRNLSMQFRMAAFRVLDDPNAALPPPAEAAPGGAG